MSKTHHRVETSDGDRQGTLNLDCRDCPWRIDAVPEAQIGRTIETHLSFNHPRSAGPLASLPPLTYIELEALAECVEFADGAQIPPPSDVAMRNSLRTAIRETMYSIRAPQTATDPT